MADNWGQGCIDDSAANVANIFIKTETEERGLLMLAIADELRKHTQYFTASCFEAAWEKYNHAAPSHFSRCRLE